MTHKSENGGTSIAGGIAVGIVKKLRRSASATEHNIFELRKRRSSSAFYDQHGGLIDLRQFRKVLDKDENGNGNVSNSEKKSRYRRTQSVTRAEEITTKEEKQRKKQPDKP